jgi:hypothetical protein
MTCQACNGKGWGRYSDHRFHSSELAECPISVCALCVGTGLMPDYPEFQPARPPSHFLKAGPPSWCLNSAMDAMDGHMPTTAMSSILRLLSDTGDAWRLATVEEVTAYDPNSSPYHVAKVLPFSSESRGVATFCREWRSVFNWEDSNGRQMKRLALQAMTDPLASGGE